MQKDYFKEFEEFNRTCESIYRLGDLEVLIILKDGTNLTSWQDVDDKDDIIFVSENLSNCMHLSYRYANLTNLKAIVIDKTSDNVTSMKSMFAFCKSLKNIYLNDFNVSKVTTLEDMFYNCISLVNLAFLKDWDVSNVDNMECMFENCNSVQDLSSLKDWNVSKVRTMECMFCDCKSLKDISALASWDVSNVNVNYTVGMFDGCSRNLDLSIFKDWDVEMLVDRDWAFAGWR